MFIKRPVPRAIAVSRQCRQLSSSRPIASTIHCRRSYAAAATATKTSTPSVPFTLSEVDGIRVVSRDDGGATTGLSFVVKAGSRYCPFPGMAHMLEKFAWKGTSKRTAFRITRETELLGGLLTSSSSREYVAISAQCLREDIPYFVEALSDVALRTNYTEHEYHDEVLPRVQIDYDAVQTSPPTLALSAIHGTAFHRGLGSPILASPTTPINVHQIADYASLAYTKSNVVIVASGATAEELGPQIQEFWKEMPAGKPLHTPAVKFHGGETRISHKTANSNTYAIAFPGSSLYGPNSSPEHIVLAHYLGGFPRIQWANGHSAFAKVSVGLEGRAKVFATNIGYSDAGLFCILAVGGPFNVAEGIAQGLKALRDIAKGTTTIKADDLKRAIASARYITYASSEARLSGLEPIGQSVLDTGKVPDTDAVVASYEKVTSDKLKQAAAKMLESTPSVAAVGQLHLLPYYDEL